MFGSRGGDRGSGLPLENYKNIGFLSNIGPDPLKITKLPIQHSMLGHHRPASETPFKWRFAGGPFKCPANSGIWILPPLIKKKKTYVKVGPSLTNFSGSPHAFNNPWFFYILSEQVRARTVRSKATSTLR